MASSLRPRTRILAFLLATLLPVPTSPVVGKPLPAVHATWRQVPPPIPLGLDVTLVLRLEATADAPNVLVELQPSPGLEFVGTALSWSGGMRAGQATDLPVGVRVLADGDWTLGARVTIVAPDVTEVSGAVLTVVARDGIARFGTDTPVLAKMAAATSAAELAALGVGMESVAAPGRDLGYAVATRIAGTVRWRDPEGHLFPVRRAYVEVADAAGALLARTSTNDTGAYVASLAAADSVRVTVFSRDVDNVRALVVPLGQPGQRYILRSAVTPVTGASTVIDVTSGATVRGAPASLSADDIAARAFAVYDAMLTFWFQATAIMGRNMQQAVTHFPESTAASAVCGISCYSSSTQLLYILREDALDWDVLGHEFFHFTTDRGALRTIDTSLGGDHNGGSAIGQLTSSTGGHVRGRDEGMRLAWSEGLATAMALLLEAQPPAAFAFPALAGIGDAIYQDTEDAVMTVNAETPPRNEGYGAENSVLGVLWDLWDTAPDASGTATDTMAGVNGPLLWQAVNGLLPGASCDRVDRFWTGITGLFGILSPTTLQISRIFALNHMAPLAGAPADAASVGGTAAPTFSWTPQGDPSAAHANDHVILAFSRDDFQTHVVIIPVPTRGATSYKPSDAEWASVQEGGTPGQVYRWFVAAERADAPQVPNGWYWYSDSRSLIPRSIEVTITWAPLGADVDLHLSNPSGTDIAYYNRTTSWGFLDRDCITTCTQEIISVASLSLRGAYRLWVQYYSDHGRGPAAVRAVVRSGRQVLQDTSFVLGATGASRTLIDFTVGDVLDGPPPAVPDTVFLPPKTP